jgi:hypothetical protein
MVLRGAIGASNPQATYSLLVVLGHSPAQVKPLEREYVFHPKHAATAGWWKGKTPPRKLSGLQTLERDDAEKEDIHDYNENGVLFQPHHSRHVLRGGAPRQDRRTTASDTSGGSGRSRHKGAQDPCGFAQFRVPNVNSLYLDKVLKVVVAVVKGAVLEEGKIMDITKIVLKLIEQNGH